MGYTRTNLEGFVLGTMLNDNGEFYDSCRVSLRRELFADRRNRFIFGIIEDMRLEGLKDTYPADVARYAAEKEIRVGDFTKFCLYMCELAETYMFQTFRRHVKGLVAFYMQDVRYGAR